MKKALSLAAAMVVAQIGATQATEPVLAYPVDRDNVLTQDQRLTVRLELAINSELPGHVTAVVINRASAVMPKGTRLIASYTPLRSSGDTRLRLCVTRAIRLDGAIMDAKDECLATLTGTSGKEGLTGSLTARPDLAPVVEIAAGTEARMALTGDISADQWRRPK